MANSSYDVSSNPRDYRLDGLLLKRIYRLSAPYWTRKGAWRSWMLLSLLLLGIFVTVAIGAMNSYLARDMTTALVAKHHNEFWRLFSLMTGAALFASFISIPLEFADSKLNLHWRSWLTTYLVDRYLQRRTYYEITLDQSIDNPDQRIQEEVGPVCEMLSWLPRLLIMSIMNMGVQAGILMSVSKTLFWCVLGFAIFQSFLTLKLYRPTIKQNFDITVAEADLRYGILHVRDHAEIVAFYRGEDTERNQIIKRIRHVIKKRLILVVYQMWMACTSNLMYVGWSVLPMVCLVPLYFDRLIAYGSIAQATAAASQLLAALLIAVKFIPTIAAAAPRAVRLAQIQEKFDIMDKAWDERDRDAHIVLQEGESIGLDKVSLTTPGGEQHLVHNLTMEIAKGESLLICGQTGVGKSSLLRAMAGLWTRGSGRITMPPASESLFLPQRPYMILADLRSQLIYPSLQADISDTELQRILERVALPNIAQQHGGFSAIKDWGRTLSLGEQQRIAFARVLVNRPQFAFLDEATSAVDNDTQTLLYELLTTSGVSYVSVGHRETLYAHHSRALDLLPEGKWALRMLKHRFFAS